MQSSTPQSDAPMNVVARMERVIGYLRRSPGARSVVYLAGTAVAMEAVWRVFRPTGPYDLVRLHLAAMPFIAAWTYACACLRPDDRCHWRHVPVRWGIRQLVLGAGIGAGAFFAWLGAAATQGWISAPEWGWERVSVHAVTQALLIQAAGHLAVAWNEEMICRGYGFDTLRGAIGLGGAAGVVTALYAVGHGVNAQILLGQAALGTTLLLLRLQSGSLWLPVGYHWAWNYVQTAVLGAPDAEPSLRPLYVQGPYLWMGRPGHPEPGFLSTLINLLVALLVLMWMRRAASQRERGATGSVTL